MNLRHQYKETYFNVLIIRGEALAYLRNGHYLIDAVIRKPAKKLSRMNVLGGY